MRSREGPGEWALTIRGQRRRRWTIEASMATLERPLTVCAVEAQGGRLSGWRFDRRTAVLRVTLEARRGTLVARGC
ncbi:MAG: hypothetical protein H0T69_12725 [Thermoleophilaceae bacterium]|nr:hypothetical protein [Thermoleophilaceae bacterium]